MHNEEVRAMKISVLLIQSLAPNYHCAENTVAFPTEEVFWLKSPTGVLKLNVDASFLNENNSDRCGTIICDDLGQLITAKTFFVRPNADALATETT